MTRFSVNVILCLQAYVCYSACLFTAKDALKRLLPELSVLDNAICEHNCGVKVSTARADVILFVQ